MSKNFVFYLLSTLILTLLPTACQTLSGATSGTDQATPRSNFVAAQEVVLAQARQPVLIESYHIGATKIMTIEVSINRQPPRTEATAGQASVFPPDLATVQVLERGRPKPASLQGLIATLHVQSQPETSNPQLLNFASPACQELLRSGGLAPTNVLTPEALSSHWTVCHIWVGRVPGTYDLSVVAIDETGLSGKPATQRIEVR